jgi:hypothetical protein
MPSISAGVLIVAGMDAIARGTAPWARDGEADDAASPQERYTTKLSYACGVPPGSSRGFVASITPRQCMVNRAHRSQGAEVQAFRVQARAAARAVRPANLN